LAAKDPEVRSLASKIAAIERHRPDEDISELHRDLRAARLRVKIELEAAGDPPLTGEQRSKLAGLLLSGGGPS
jgi:hypothetical protein